VQVCYLTCGFVGHLPSAELRTALMKTPVPEQRGCSPPCRRLGRWPSTPKSPKTIISHLVSAKRLEAYLEAEDLPLEPEGIRVFLPAERNRTSSASAANYYRNLRMYFHWLIAEGQIKEDPTVRVEKPKVAEEVKPLFTEAEPAALLKIHPRPGLVTAFLSLRPRHRLRAGRSTR
jgi:site-specific recombinase XerD